MKKLLLLSVIALTVMACQSDDDTPPVNETSIVGTWKFLESYENEILDENDLCDTEETLVFSANGDFSGESYDDFNTPGTCELEDSTTGTWSNTGNLFSITTDGQTETVEVVFEENTFYFEETFVENEETFIEKIVYIKQ